MDAILNLITARNLVPIELCPALASRISFLTLFLRLYWLEWRVREFPNPSLINAVDLFHERKKHLVHVILFYSKS